MFYIKGKHIKKSKSKIYMVYVIVILIAIICFSNFIEYDMIKDFNLEKTQVSNLNLLDKTISKQLMFRYSTHPDLNNILSNINKYPDELLNLALDNPETVSFVSNYINYLSSNSTEVLSTKNDYNTSDIPLFLQWDERWGYEIYGDNFIGINGCAPTSLAMVIAGLTDDTSITPKEICDYSYENDFYIDAIGSSWTIIPNTIEEYGLKCSELPLIESVILSTLKDGNPIIVTVGPGTFTSWGHFLVLTGVTNDNKITINDPNSKINSSKAWDIDIFLNESKNLWSISL